MSNYMPLIKNILIIIENFFLIYLIVYSTFLFLSAIVGSITLYKDRINSIYHNKIKHEYYFPISILVPAYNEEITIVDSIMSLLDIDYKLYEIIIINDGSTDNTLEVLKKNFNLKKSNMPINKKLKTKKINAIYKSNKYKIPIIVVMVEKVIH